MSRPSSTVKQSWHHFVFSLFVKLFLVLGVFVTAFFLYCNHIITHEFITKTKQMPAEVYAAPMELFVGQHVTQGQVAQTLSALGYQAVHHAPSSPGQYQVSANAITFRSRPFDFWDGERSRQDVVMTFQNGGVTSVKDAIDGQDLGLFRLEPQLIGGIYPNEAQARVFLREKQVPLLLKKALIASEDRTFYTNWGVSLKSIARALLVDLKAGGYVQGGSTLSQQLVKNLFLTDKKTLSRKAQGVTMAFLLNLHYSKPEILQAYMNEVYLGQNGSLSIHGFGLASLYYFGLPVSSLSLQQIALLVAIIPAPSYYSPLRHPQRAKKRRNLILAMMEKQGVIDDAQATEAMAAPLGLTDHPRWGNAAYPAFMDLVRRELKEHYSPEALTQDGLRIFTTLNIAVQRTANQVVSQRLAALEHSYHLPKKELQAAMVVVDPNTAKVLAVVGGRNVHYDGYNRAIDASRPIGSLAKPAVYLDALSQPEKYSLATPLLDRPVYIQGPNGQVWSPRNASEKSHGMVSLETALARSYNEATVRLGMQLGLSSVFDTLAKMGIEKPVPAYPANLLGAFSLSPLQVAKMYETLANGGFSSPLRTVEAVTTADGKPLKHFGLAVKKVFDPASIYLTNLALQEVGRTGTGRFLYWIIPKDLQFAGKTGSSQDLRDGWFAGFTGDYLSVVWVGRDDDKSTRLYGQQGAGDLWAWLMRRLDAQPLSLVAPPNIAYAWVNKKTGLQRQRQCPNAVKVPFVESYLPSSGQGVCGDAIAEVKAAHPVAMDHTQHMAASGEASTASPKRKTSWFERVIS